LLASAGQTRTLQDDAAGIQLNTTPQDCAPYQSLRMAKFEGSSWKLIDEVSTSASAK
jgi:branched-chain amino acid transport system substrate-binding protein